MWALIDQLVCQGVTDYFFAPGSRSTPLVIAAAAHPQVSLHRHFDERGLGFYALGMALAKEMPVAVIVTSGSAVGNLLPAVMEAHHAAVPLILLTADRPIELRECSSNQTTDQSRLFGSFVRWQFEFEPSMPEKALRSQAVNAVLQATGYHPGPVHLNCPQRDPLYSVDFFKSKGSLITLHRDQSSHLSLPKKSPRGVILLGRLPKRSQAGEVLRLADRLQWPVFADILSGARSSPTSSQVFHYDWFLKDSKTSRPDTVLHFGERLTSKRVMEWLRQSPPPCYTHISPYPNWNDPYQLVTERLVTSIPSACAALEAEIDSSWLSSWQALDREAKTRLDRLFTNHWSESSAIRSLSKLTNRAIFLGSSMPIREADWFLFPDQANGFFCNRGLSGIDGNLATAVGVAEGLGKPLLAILGDLTTLHDLNSLALLQQSKQPIQLIVSNNGGGGIFSHLPVAIDARFEELIAFEHSLHFKQAAEMFSIPHILVNTEAELIQAMKTSGTCLIELITSRKANRAFHQALLTSK